MLMIGSQLVTINFLTYLLPFLKLLFIISYSFYNFNALLPTTLNAKYSILLLS